MPLNRRRVTSAAEMRALAHPVRLDLLELLLTRGPMTSSDAAAELDQTPANVSWHFRKLAEHGFVRQASDGPGRRRPWKIVAESLSWGDDADDAAMKAALHDLAIDREVQRLRAALAAHESEPERWRDATSVHQALLWLTADEARDLGDRLRELFVANAERVSDPTSRPPDARLMAVMSWVVPTGPDTTGAAA